MGDRLAALVRDVQTMQQLRRVAERYGALPRDSPIAEELVFDVIEDVLSGDAKCDAASKLAPQLWRHVVRHACRYRNAAWTGSKERPAPRLVPLDKAPADALSIDAPLQLLDEPRHEPPDPATLVAEWAACVREQARDEPAVRQLLENYLQNEGSVSRRELLAAGMSKWTYRAAKKRLDDYGTKARHAVAARHAAVSPASESDESEAQSDDAVPRLTRADRARRAVRGATRRNRRLRSA